MTCLGCVMHIPLCWVASSEEHGFIRQPLSSTSRASSLTIPPLVVVLDSLLPMIGRVLRRATQPTCLLQLSHAPSYMAGWLADTDLGV